MEQSPLDRAAKVLYTRFSHHSDEWDSLHEFEKADWLEDARAVIEAISEPSPEMLDAGNDLMAEIGCNPLTGDEAKVWQAMIDTILAPQYGLPKDRTNHLRNENLRLSKGLAAIYSAPQPKE